MDPYVGEIRMFAGNYAPENWLLCDGSLLSIQECAMLYSLIGNSYGGDGQRTFALPDMRGRIPIGSGEGKDLSPRYIGQSLGVETMILSTDHLPAHSHQAMGSSDKATDRDPTGRVLGVTPFSFYSDGDLTQGVLHDFAPTSVTSAGGGESHANIMPFLTINYIICYQGIYPQR